MGFKVNRHGYAGGVAGARFNTECEVQRDMLTGARLAIKTQEQLIDMATATGVGTGTVTVTAAIPAGAFDVWATALVKVVLAGVGLTTWSLGVTGDTDRFATGKAKTAGVTVTPEDYAADNACFDVYQAAVNILFTAAAGQFDTGQVRLCLFFKTITAPLN